MAGDTLIDPNVSRVISERIAAEDETKDTRYYLDEYFKRAPCINADINSATEATREPANPDFEILGTNGTSALATFSTTNAGILLTTAGADDDQMIVLPHLDTKQSAWTNIKWGTENQVEWTCSIKTVAITTCIIWAGLKLTNTPVIATDADQVFFRFSTDDSDTTWKLESSIGGTDTATDSLVTVEANTQYKFKIVIDETRKAKCYINDVLVYTTAALTNDKDFIPYVGIQSVDATPSAASMILNFEKINRILFE